MRQIDHFGLWNEQPIVVIDTETTGFVATQGDKMVQLAAVRVERGAVTARWNTLLNPERPIPSEASQIHGVWDHDVYDAPRFCDVVLSFIMFVDGCVPCAYGQLFDRGFLRAELFDLGLADIDVPIVQWPNWIDPLVWVRSLDRFVAGSEGNSLVHACKRRGIEIANAHSAPEDAEATAKLLMLLAPEIGLCTASELIRRQPYLNDAHRRRREAARAQGRPC